jgi:hypothetical protein
MADRIITLEDGRVVADKTPNLAHIGRAKITFWWRYGPINAPNIRSELVGVHEEWMLS